MSCVARGLTYHRRLPLREGDGCEDAKRKADASGKGVRSHSGVLRGLWEGVWINERRDGGTAEGV